LVQVAAEAVLGARSSVAELKDAAADRLAQPRACARRCERSEDPSDPNGLDADNDGQACEDLATGTSAADTSGSTTQLASTGSDIWILGGAGFLALAGAFALRRRARA
jgi:LPXTG-motif cell wall-anchored protein